MKPYFPSYVRIEWARFPDGEVLRRELGDAGFEDARIHHLGIKRRFSRDEALKKLRGRASQKPRNASRPRLCMSFGY